MSPPARVGPRASRDEVPEYARTGRVRYARWDGGSLEAAKGILSGWYYLREPRALEATVNWYRGSASLELLCAAGINWIWVTFSNGFSLETERPEQERIAEFARRCHDFGIRVTAYASMVNLFIDDMRRHHPGVDEWLQRDLAGNPIPYGAAKYSGAPTRLLACLNHPEWVAYLRARVKRALEIGLDGYEYDNQHTGCRCARCRGKWESFLAARNEPSLPWIDAPEAATASPEDRIRIACLTDLFRLAEYQEIYAMTRSLALAERPGFLLYGNFNTGYQTFTLPTNNAVSTEDGAEPGIVEGRLVQNFGTLRTLSGAGAGWRPVRVEHAGGRGRGQLRKTMDEAGVGATRFVPMEGVKHQLSMAEAAVHGCSFQVTPEGEFLRDLTLRRPLAMENWRCIAACNRFFAAHEDLYRETRTETRTVSLHASGFRRPGGDDYAQRPALIGELARRGVLLDVRYEQDLDESLLEPYRVMLLADVWSLSRPMVRAVQDFAGRGGRIVATGQTGWYDEHFRRRHKNPLAGSADIQWETDPSQRDVLGAAQDSQSNFFAQWPQDPARCLEPEKLDRLAAVLLHLDPPPVEVQLPFSVLRHVTRDPEGRLLVHLLNYDDASRPDATVRLSRGALRHWELFTPDEPRPTVSAAGGDGLLVKELSVYCVLRLTVGEG